MKAAIADEENSNGRLETEAATQQLTASDRVVTVWQCVEKYEHAAIMLQDSS